MAQTSEGASKARKALIAKYGGLKGYKAHMTAVGASGGKAKYSKPRGFAAMSVEDRTAIAIKGGKARKRGTKDL